MPSHTYVPKRHPPTPWDIIRTHAVEIATAANSATVGTIILVHHQNIGSAFLNTPLVFLPPFLIVGIGMFCGVGGLMALAGLLLRHDNIRVELNVEQAGWTLLGVGWFAFLYTAVRYTDNASLTITVSLFTVLGALLRVIALTSIERDLEAVVEEVMATSDPEGDDDAG